MSSNDRVILPFGYGKVIFSIGALGDLSVYIANDTRPVGTSVSDIDIYNSKFYPITANSYSELLELKTKLSAVEAGIIKVFAYKNFKFDFSNYDK